MTFNKKIDLTRWNRAGLSEFRYIDGNALTYLEALRQQLAENYDKDGTPSWKELLERFPERPGEKPSQTRKRLNDQYHDERRDYAWEILRSFSRSTHILGEYLNAYANEAYLPTAVEWDNVRKLVALLDYQPSPPASAETHIALLFKEGESGEIDKGFAVKNKPGKGESTVIFETQEKLQGSEERNRLHLLNWNKNPKTLASYRKGKKQVLFPLEGEPEDINIGDIGVLGDASIGVVIKVADITSNTAGRYLRLKLQNLADKKRLKRLELAETSLYLSPEFVESPLPNGGNSAVLKETAGFSEQEITFGKNTSGWHARRVEKNELQHLRFENDSAVTASNEKLYRARILKRQRHPKLEGNARVYLLPEDFSESSGYFVDSNLNELSLSITNGTGDTESLRYIKADHGKEIYYPDKIKAGEVRKSPVTSIRFAGKASALESRQWALVQQGKTLSAKRIDSIEQEHEDWFSINLQASSDDEVRLLRSVFKLELKPRDHDVNNSKAWSSKSSDAVSILRLQNADQADQLKPGQRLICASEDQAFSVEIKDSKLISGVLQLHVAPPFHSNSRAENATLHNTVIYANVVRATHGETQPEKIVGNGDASQTNQCFELPPERIAWVADAAFTSGVRADLEVRIGQRQWQQVEDLSQSEPEAHDYEVRVNEDDVLSICFGDGRHGRRLPTGIDNVRVRYRTGYGEEGNLAANALVKIARPDLRIEDFVAPLAAYGGAEKESSASMRESAPATVLALGRAVSLQDFTHLAAHHSMVWQAQAFEKMPDRPARSEIEVVVVAAGGAPFTKGSDTAELIKHFLVEHAAPGTPVSVISYEPLFMQLQLSIMVDESAFDKKQVQDAVLEHVKTRLDIRQRKLGQALFRSEVIALLEEVEGVENGHCEIHVIPYASLMADSKPRVHTGADGKVRKLAIKPHQLMYLDTARYPLDISLLTYEL